MATSSQLEIKQLRQEAQKQGFDVELKKSGHYHVTKGDKRGVMSLSPSSSTASRRARDDLVKAGFVAGSKGKRERVTVDLGAEGSLLLHLSSSDRPQSRGTS